MMISMQFLVVHHPFLRFIAFIAEKVLLHISGLLLRYSNLILDNIPNLH